jgi:hypothetical protein
MKDSVQTHLNELSRKSQELRTKTFEAEELRE